MVQTSHVAKRQKTEECTSFMESVLFNSDSLFKIASYLPAEGFLNLALTCRRFGVPPLSDDDDEDDSLSLIDETARIIVHDVATEEQRNALPGYDGDNWLYKYHYLQLLQMPLTFDQLVGQHIDYVKGNKSCVTNLGSSCMVTAFSNNIMMAGKHYVSFEASSATCLLLGVMRPGKSMQSAQGDPLQSIFYEHFTQREGSRQYNNSVNCCMYYSYSGHCCSSAWEGHYRGSVSWEGMERTSFHCKIGMLLDLDEGTLSVYKNERRLGVMKRGLAGHYCWAVAMLEGEVAIKRGTVPAS